MYSRTTLTYLLTDLPLAESNPNPVIFKQQLSASGFTTASVTKSLEGGLLIELPTINGTILSASDYAAISALAANHTGGDFAPAQQNIIENALESDDSGDAIIKLELNSGLLSAGKYTMSWNVEVALTNANTSPPTSIARAIFSLQVNGGAMAEQSEHNCDLQQFQTLAGSFPLTLVNGDRLILRLSFQRIGASNPARCRRARLSISKDNS